MPAGALSKERLPIRLRRVGGQMRRLQQIIESDRSCKDILMQTSGVTKTSQIVAGGMVDAHLRHCVADAVARGGHRRLLKS